MGEEDDWYDYYLHWNNLTRIKEMDEKTGSVKRKIWVRSGDDHWAHATAYWRVGMTRFGGQGTIVGQREKQIIPNGIELNPDDTMTANILKDFRPQQEHDWRTI